MKLPDKDKWKSMLATVVFHSLLLICLIFMALKTPLPLPEEQGVEVDLGNSMDGTGFKQPDFAGTAMPTPQAQAAAPENARVEILTQNTEEAPPLPEIKKETPKKNVEKPKPVPKPVPKPEVKAEPEKVVPIVDQRALFKGSTQNAQSGGSDGITGNEGDQGKPDGLKDVKRYEGDGGSGGGPRVSLGGRGTKYLDKPQTEVTERGEVVVDIWVDRSGQVQKASVGTKGTTIVSSTLRSIAVKAALRSTFAPDPDAAELQKGTITYTFII